MTIKPSKVSTLILGIIAITFLIIGLLLTSIEWVSFDLNYYDKEYKKLNIPESTGMSQMDLLNTTNELLSYIRGKRGDLNISAMVHGQERLVFNQREIDHMVDVKDLFALGFKLRWISFGVFLAITVILIKFYGREALRSLSVSYFTVLSILIVFSLILLVLIFIDFTEVWNTFHHVFFKNDLWLLDPDTDILIQMVPEQFFFDTVIRIFSLFGGALVALGIYSGITLYKSAKLRKGSR